MSLAWPFARRIAVALGAAVVMAASAFVASAPAQDSLPWKNGRETFVDRNGDYDRDGGRSGDSYGGSGRDDSYPQQGTRRSYEGDDSYRQQSGGDQGYRSERSYSERSGRDGDYGEPYADSPRGGDRYGERYNDGPPYRDDRGTYSQSEIMAAGHGFFGSISKGLASVVEHAFRKSGRPNGYILGEDAGGAFVAGLRYGEGTLYTKEAGDHRVFWQGPSIGYDFGGEGSKTMVLVYNLRDPSDIFHRFMGVQGSAYLVGGVSIQYQQYGDVVLAPIRSGVGVRLGANVGYLKYTRSPTWNPF